MLSDTTNSITKFEPQKECHKQKLMEYLVHIKCSRDIIRIGPKAFIQLCQRIRQSELVKDTYRSTMEKQVAKFLHIIGHNVLIAILRLEGDFLNQPGGSVVQVQILNSNQFYPYFKVRL